MAEDNSWDSIKEHGLLSTSALLTKWEYTGTDRDEIEFKWRSKKIPIYHPEYGEAVIRDQIPMPPDKLNECLIGMTPEEWYGFINNRVFFWVTWRNLEWFLAAKQYRNKPQLVITADTRGLIGRHESRITLSSINTGSTYPDKYGEIKPRGRDTFKKIREYDVPFVTELAVEGDIPDITEITISVTRWVARKMYYDEPKYQKLSDVWP